MKRVIPWWGWLIVPWAMLVLLLAAPFLILGFAFLLVAQLVADAKGWRLPWDQDSRSPV